MDILQPPPLRNDHTTCQLVATTNFLLEMFGAALRWTGTWNTGRSYTEERWLLPKVRKEVVFWGWKSQDQSGNLKARTGTIL